MSFAVMKQTWLYAAEQAVQDPIWLRTLVSVLPVVGTVLVALVGAPWLVEKYKNRNEPTQTTAATTPGKGLPAPVAIEAHERAQADPLLRLLIEDLHSRLSAAHREVERLNMARVDDAGHAARLAAELEDKEARFRECERELSDKTTQVRYLRQKVEQLSNEVAVLRRRLQVAVEGFDPPS